MNGPQRLPRTSHALSVCFLKMMGGEEMILAEELKKKINYFKPLGFLKFIYLLLKLLPPYPKYKDFHATDPYNPPPPIFIKHLLPRKLQLHAWEMGKKLYLPFIDLQVPLESAH